MNGVELHIFHKDAKEFDLVKSAKAEFDMNSGMLYSDGDVEITMDVPADEEPSGRLMTIKSSGVHLEARPAKPPRTGPPVSVSIRAKAKPSGAATIPRRTSCT